MAANLARGFYMTISQGLGVRLTLLDPGGYLAFERGSWFGSWKQSVKDKKRLPNSIL